MIIRAQNGLGLHFSQDAKISKLFNSMRVRQDSLFLQIKKYY